MFKPKKLVLITFLGPAVLCYLVVFLYPTLRTFAMSFFSVVGVSDPASTWTFYGIGNFVRIFNAPIFIHSLRNIGRIWFFGGIGVMFTALLFAVILTGDLKGTKFFRASIYLPNVVSAVAMAAMWINYVFNSNWGLLHNVFSALGMEEASQILWTGPGTRFWSMLVAYCFGMVGYHMLIFISGIERIPKDYTEAALIEGANVFRRFFIVTLPFIKGVTRTNIVIWTTLVVGFFVWGHLFSPVHLSFDTVAPMNYVFRLVFGAVSPATPRDSGAAAAIGVVMMAIVVIVFLASSLIVRKDDTEV
jgi:multiple sugar transport system permease protein